MKQAIQALKSTLSDLNARESDYACELDRIQERRQQVLRYIAAIKTERREIGEAINTLKRL